MSLQTTDIYDGLADMALELIALYGQDVVLRDISFVAPPDPLKPWRRGVNDDGDTTVKMAFFNETRVDQYGHNRIEETLVGKGEEYGLMAGKGNPLPKIKDVVLKGVEELRIVYVNEISPGGIVLAYRIGVNR